MAHVPRFDPSALATAANETFTVRRVFGEAYERDGVTVIPVARVWAATGLGAGDGEGGGALPTGGWARRARAWAARGRGVEEWDAAGQGDDGPADEDASTSGDDDTDPDTHGGYGGGHGGGGGYGAHVKAVGVFVVDDDGVHWRPALDLNRVILGGQLVAVAAVASAGAALAVTAVAKAVSHAVAAFADR
ncbi:hypothetical protein ACT17Q_09550 [Cellulomonas sp. CW35]|uniref:Uncharacterized protein n=1 Tax=Cellulomonas uda TaxID=1714 RepID=A0A4Y3KEU8_CELUD|nr:MULTISPECIES: hypothetical protein [Cellulomonas]ASR54354.1 hypothetical protein CBP52_03465 [Cellulomonas sp. PSBB021]NII67221.1 putative spore protein YtfJ [Cellulomonas uda]GEA81565.1 hypothetical protein CUD01_20090 [Cellulomonas uda]